MKHLHELAKEIVQVCASNYEIHANVKVADILTYLLDDVFKLYENINSTSFNRDDRTKRIYEMGEKFGIPKTHILCADRSEKKIEVSYIGPVTMPVKLMLLELLAYKEQEGETEYVNCIKSILYESTP